MLPVIALVGRPNVGKSTLFNVLTGTRDAIVADRPGLTRDRQYGYGDCQQHPFIVVDTGGIGIEAQALDHLTSAQTQQAIAEADVILFMVDARDGVTPADRDIVQTLRPIKKPVYLVLNKIDGMDAEMASAEFAELGMGAVIPISAAHKRGIQALLESVLESQVADEAMVVPEEVEPGIKIAIIGRPNVGKSTLVNRMLGEERVTVFDMPGTTRDSISIPFERRGQRYTLIDTAGVRRRAKIDDIVEKFSVIKALQAMEVAHVVIFVVDAQEGIAEQDLKLLGLVLASGKAVVIAVNKWDGLSDDAREQVRKNLHRRLVFLDYAAWHFISALHGSGVGKLFGAVGKAYQSAMQELSTPELTRILETAIAAYQPPMSKGRRIKLRYAHPGGSNPPTVVIHGNQLNALPNSYVRYLEKYYRKTLNLVGTPVRIVLRTGDNPYAGKKNTLTPRQMRKRQRLKQFTKKRK